MFFLRNLVFRSGWTRTPSKKCGRAKGPIKSHNMHFKHNCIYCSKCYPGSRL